MTGGTLDLFPMVTFDAITRDELNACLVGWGHQMGPNLRAFTGWQWGLRHNGQLVAVVSADTLITPVVAGLSRDEAVELSRSCAVRPDLNRAVLRLWREFAFPALGYPWAVSYQDERLHTGNLYRFDGWVPLARTRSGTDQRSGAKGRRKTAWGWCADPAQRQARGLR